MALRSFSWSDEHERANGTRRDNEKARSTLHRLRPGETVEQFLDLGQTALANKFLTAEELLRPEATYPLDVGFCHTCGHVQLMEVVPPSAMFEDYL